MKKDIGIKVLFIVILLISIYMIISGLVSSDSKTNEIYEKDIELSSNNISLYVGDKYIITYKVLPEDTKYKSVTWYSVNPSIASVKNGELEGISEGNTIVRVTSENQLVNKIIQVNVMNKIVEVTEIRIINNNIIMDVGDTKKIEYEIVPDDATDKNVSMTSSDTSILAFDNEGNIVAIKDGDATVTIKSKNGIEASVSVHINKKIIEAEKITLNKEKETIKVNETVTLKATITPSDTTDKTVTWESSDTSICQVLDGVVKGLKEGSCVITAKTSNNKAVTCNITVKADTLPAITDDSKYKIGKEIASYKSKTLKYRIQNVGSADYVLVWVADPYKQINSAIPSFGNEKTAEVILSHEISTYGYQKKGLVATNGSFFWAGWGGSPGIPYVINKGKVLRDVENKKYSNNIYGTVGITKDGILKMYSGFSSTNYNANMKVKNEMQKDGIRNNFAYAVSPIGNDGSLLNPDSGRDSTNRTVICQVNKNNFVIYSGGGLSLYGIGKELKSRYGCVRAANLDGGGSRKLYYKTGSMSSAKKRFGGGRAIADMFYIVED